MATVLFKPCSITGHGCVYVQQRNNYAFSRVPSSLKTVRRGGKASRQMCSAVTIEKGVRQEEYSWTKIDEFSHLNDRVDSPPLPLPPIKEPKRVIMVRHGQSTWNAEGRIQGSSNASVLTKKGESQAETTRQMVRSTGSLERNTLKQGYKKIATVLKTSNVPCAIRM